MEDPSKEISQVILQVAAGETPDIQKAAIEKYFAPDAGFRHPMAAVNSGTNSRDSILGVYQWYRIMSPKLNLEVKNTTYNESTKELFVEVLQQFHIRWSPFSPSTSRLLVHLVLKPSEADPNLHVIALQEDMYHPEDQTSLLVPPLVPVVRLLLKAGALGSNINTRLFNLLGYWSPKGSNSSNGNGQQNGGPTQPEARKKQD